MAGLLAHTATFPIDVARTTMAVSSHKAYRNLSQAIRETIRKGGFRGLYAGYSASLIGVVPNAAIRFGMYDLFKEAYAGVRQQFQQKERGCVSVEDCQGTRTQRSMAGEYGDLGEDRPFIGDCVRRK
ncbi:uncharacterized protein [Hetaerina americana]|uniref:uncharacterized protein n=1 Tax=Hetaerina americana TaxID=62018 RepID=UPI003A7F448D